MKVPRLSTPSSRARPPRQLVEIQQSFPLRLRVCVIGDRRAPPDALGMLCVLPEIEDKLVIQFAGRNAVGRIEDLENSIEILLIIGIGFQHGGGIGVLRLDPFHRPGPVNVFEPEVRVG